MRAGKLDRELTIVRYTVVGKNDLNEAIYDWKEIETVFAQQRPNRGSERFAAGQVAATAVMTFHMHFYPGLTAEDRLIYDGKTYEIVAPPREIGRRVVTEVDAVARADE